VTAEGRTGLARLSLNQATIPAWTLPQAADGCARAGVGWIAPWRDRVAEAGLRESARAIRDAGLRVSSLCRGGWFDAADEVGRRERMNDNRRAVDEAAELGAMCLVLVCGPAPDRDLAASRDRVGAAVTELAEYASERGVTLAVEPLHPMYCGDRSVVVTLDQALALARSTAPPERVGVVIDAYHVWWDPMLLAGIEACRGRILGFHVSDWLVPTPDMLNGRGMMGDGVIDLRLLRRSIDAAGYSGPIEVEIFNPELWSLPPVEALELVAGRYLENVVEEEVRA
jgi:sugar phosphate isomerase/epimerase